MRGRTRRAGGYLGAALGGLLLASIAVPAAGYDAEAGRQKAEEACAPCHGPGGNPEVDTVPSLAGQPFRFIVLSLYQYRAKRRLSDAMTPAAAELSDDDLGNLAAYYGAQQPAPIPLSMPAGPRDADRDEAAKALLTQYHCNQCHGPQMRGQEHIPRLAGQPAGYLKEQLLGFKAATRGDIDGLMTSAAQPLTPVEIDAITDYLASLSPS
jgi:cytochrome c553